MDLTLKPLLKHPGYSVDKQGNVYSYWNRGKFLKNTPVKMKGSKNSGGHIKVSMKGGKKEFVHRLVYEAFIGDIPPGMIVRHLNDIPHDNRPENLAIGTMKDNSDDSLRNGSRVMGEKTHNSKLTTEDVVVIRSLAGLKTQKQIAEIYGINKAYVSSIVNKKVWKHVQ